jgi:hypothetical protein
METEIVFNCQMGRGRTTTGMVISTLVYLNRIGASGEHQHVCISYVELSMDLLHINNFMIAICFELS